MTPLNDFSKSEGAIDLPSARSGERERRCARIAAQAHLQPKITPRAGFRQSSFGHSASGVAVGFVGEVPCSFSCCGSFASPQ